ncbi:Outer membrane protein assembly factor BamA [bacterium HR21]|nr:Outer membrane protein assembly factor BamA [bacterium HR21]
MGRRAGSVRRAGCVWLGMGILLAGSLPLRAADSVWVAGVEVRSGIEGLAEVRLCLQPRQRYPWERFRECVREDSLRLLRWVQEQGYWFARLSLRWDAQQGWMCYELEPGQRVRIGAVRVTVVPDTPAALEQPLRWSAEQVLAGAASRSRVEAFLDTLLRSAMAAGYPEAWADIAEVRLAGTEVELRVVLSLGEPATADTLLFQGVEPTGIGFLQRWVALPSKAPVSEDMLRAAQKRLEQLGWLELVEPPQLFRIADGRWGVLFRVRERATARFDGFLGYAPAAGWNGMLQARLDNLFGTGRSGTLRWYRAGAQLQELLLQYEEPFPPFALIRGRFEMRQHDTLYTEVGWELGFRWLGTLAHGWWLELVGGRRRVEPSGVASLAPSLSWYGGVGAELQRLQPRDNPVRGVLLRVFPTVRWQRVLGSSQGQRGRFASALDAEVFLPVRFPFVVRLHGHGRLLWGRTLQREEFYRLGGVQTLRGYREAQFLSPRAGWGGIEGRWVLGGHDHVGAFVELGWIDSVGWRHGFGLQWQFHTAVGVLQLSLAWGRDDRLQEAKLGVRVLDGAL